MINPKPEPRYPCRFGEPSKLINLESEPRDPRRIGELHLSSLFPGPTFLSSGANSLLVTSFCTKLSPQITLFFCKSLPWFHQGIDPERRLLARRSLLRLFNLFFFTRRLPHYNVGWLARAVGPTGKAKVVPKKKKKQKYTK